jgi:hypothetical protein
MKIKLFLLKNTFRNEKKILFLNTENYKLFVDHNLSLCKKFVKEEKIKVILFLTMLAS